MIEELRIDGLGVIESATLELGPGLTAVTGETGAGKTMVLTGLGLLFGGRPDAGSVRRGRAHAAVEGRVRLPGHDAAVDATRRVTERVADAGGALDEDVLVVARTVAAEGRSRAYLGGRSVPAAVLAEVGADLLVVHGQSDQQRLLRPALQREAIDRFGGADLLAALTQYRAGFDRLRGVEQELTELTTRARERAREAELLRAGLAEIDGVAPEPGEDLALAAEADRLSYAEALREAAQHAHAALRADAEASGREVDALTLVAEAGQALDRAIPHDGSLSGPRARLAEAAALLDDVAAELASYAAGVDTDPLRLAAVEERRAALGGLRRRYGDTVDEVLAWATESRRRLLALEGDDERIDALRAERASLRESLGDLAATLTRLRRAAAAALAARVGAELADLSMPNARLEVAVTPRPADPDGLLVPGVEGPVGFGRSGVDAVEFLLAPHAGAPPRPLARGASGGELSRVMLALEVVLAETDPVPTFVFDEVDAGVGGRAAVEVGRRLARLARTRQVLVVTHLPQVAAFADRHLVVRKSDDGEVTEASVTRVADDDRVRELARMLAGLEESDAAAAHAAELLALGAAERAAAPAPPARTGGTRRRARR